MERYEQCTELQKKILDEMYIYFGFNEVITFEDFLDFFFTNTRSGISFENIVNHSLANIMRSFKSSHPEYIDYIKYFWLDQKKMLEHMKVGSNIEYDPKGIIRAYIKENITSVLSKRQ